MLLLMASLMAIATLDDSVLQERMATNHQNINRAFQASESAIDNHIETVTEGGNIAMYAAARTAGDQATPSWPQTNFNSGSDNISTAMTIIYKGEVSLSGGNSLDANESSVRITGARFEYVATSSITNTGASVDVVQGIEYR